MEASTNKKYKLIKRIGEGASGKAYLVENLIEKTLCVIKTIYIDLMNEDEKKDAFIEASILEKLEHPNIIKFMETFLMKKKKHSLCIVMEYADGGDLKTKIALQKEKYFEENQILDWFTQICLALKHVHDRKILHRDLKSQNIFLSKNGLVKVGDFGIAKCLNYTMDKANTYIGTPYYLSPEIVNNLDYSFKSDIWSLGVLLYEMICLKVPFEASNLASLSLKIIKGVYTPIPSHFSKDLKNLQANLLSVDDTKRPNINTILKFPIIKSRIKNLLNEVDYCAEFSHTILHNFHPLKASCNVNKITKQTEKEIIETRKEKRVISSSNKSSNKETSINTKSSFQKKIEMFSKKDGSPQVNDIYKSTMTTTKNIQRIPITPKNINREKSENLDYQFNSNEPDIKKKISAMSKVLIDLTKDKEMTGTSRTRNKLSNNYSESNNSEPKKKYNLDK